MFSNGIGLTWKTTDGGVQWAEQQFTLYRQYNGTAAISNLKNTIAGAVDSVGETSLTTKTTNGGTTWLETRFLHGESFTYVEFADSLHGWILTSANSLLRTDNGGATWDRVQAANQFDLISFLDSTHGRAIWGVWCYRTDDGGRTWDSISTIPYIEPPGFRSLSFADTLNGWAVGDRFYQGHIAGTIYRTTTGGRIWYEEAVDLSDMLTAVRMVDARHGWAVSSEVAGGGRILKYGLLTSVAERLEQLPRGLRLRQNYPNPFNPTTTIEYEIPARTHVELVVFDLLGKRVRLLVNEMEGPGVYRLHFNGGKLPSGVYVYELRTSHHQLSKQMTIVK
jgi:photosystem II stability/assembly factor-like uncharacterized protein